MIKLTFPDGSIKEYRKGIKVVEVIESISSYALNITAYKPVGRDYETSIDTVNCFKPLSFRRIISSFKRLSENEKERIIEIMKEVTE